MLGRLAKTSFVPPSLTKEITDLSQLGGKTYPYARLVPSPKCISSVLPSVAVSAIPLERCLTVGTRLQV